MFIFTNDRLFQRGTELLCNYRSHCQLLKVCDCSERSKQTFPNTTETGLFREFTKAWEADESLHKKFHTIIYYQPYSRTVLDILLCTFCGILNQSLQTQNAKACGVSICLITEEKIILMFPCFIFM